MSTTTDRQPAIQASKRKPGDILQNIDNPKTKNARKPRAKFAAGRNRLNLRPNPLVENKKRG